MPVILLDKETLPARGTRVSQLLRILSRIPDGPAHQMRWGREAVIIGTHEGSPVQSDFRQWRFATPVRGFWAQYYERWTPLDSTYREFCLDRAYLTILQDGTSHLDETREFVCLHCDPNEPDSDETNAAIYKRGPHLHINVAEDPIPKSHLALAMGHLDAVLCSAESLTDALEWSMRLIKDEILAKIAAT